MKKRNLKIIKSKILLLNLIKNKIKFNLIKIFKHNSQLQIKEGKNVLITPISKNRLKSICLITGKHKSNIKIFKLSRNQTNRNIINNFNQNCKINSW